MRIFRIESLTSFLSFLLLVLFLAILFPTLLIQFSTTNLTIRNLQSSIETRLSIYASDFTEKFHNECARCEDYLAYFKDYVYKPGIKYDDIGSYFFDSEHRFHQISLLDGGGVPLLTLITNPDQTYLSPKSYEEFRSFQQVNLKGVDRSKDLTFIPLNLLPVPDGYIQRTLMHLNDKRFLLADINISSIISNAIKKSIVSYGALILVYGKDRTTFYKNEEVSNEEIFQLASLTKAKDYELKDKVYRVKQFAIDSLPVVCNKAGNLGVILGIEYSGMLQGIRTGVQRGLLLTTIFAGLIGFIFVFIGIYLKNSTDRIIKRTEEISSGDFDGKISISLPYEFSMLSQNINRLSLELKRLTSERIQSAKLAAIGKFAAHLVHDLRSPVYGISLLTNELKKIISPEQPFYRYFQEISSGIERLGQIIDKIADHSKIYEPRLEDVEINRLIKETAEEFLRTFPCKIDFLFGNVGLIKIDPGQWRRVFRNLFQNSFEARKEDCQITIKTSLLESSVVIEISDQSGGINPEFVENIFEPFFTTKKKGHGLGLSYVKEVIEAHRGSIDLENQPGRGLKFIITIPRS